MKSHLTGTLLNVVRRHFTIAGVGVLVFLTLFFISRENYLLFHTLAEMFSIVTAFMIFVLTWNARRILNNGYLVMLGISFLFTASVAVLHTLAYKGMGVFEIAGQSANLATQLWLVGRYLYGGSLVVAPFFLHRLSKVRYVFLSYLVVTALLLLSVLYWRVFPESFVEGSAMPLTDFKIYSELLINVLLVMGAALLLRIREYFDRDVLLLLVFSILINVPSGFFFTVYLTPFDLRNLFGHYFQIVSFYLIYKAVIETGFRKPQELLYRDLLQSEKALRESEAALRMSESNERARSAQLEAIMDAVPAVVWIAHDSQARLVTGNRASSELLRLNPQDNQSKTAPDGQAPTHFKVFKDGAELAPEALPLQISAATGQPVRHFEETVVFDDGVALHLLGNVTPLLDENQRPSGAVAAFIDITERVQAEQALQESEQRYRGLFETMAEGFSLHEILYDAQGQAVDYSILEINPAFERLTGLKREQVVGKRIRELVPNVSEEWIQRYARVAETGESLRFEDYSTLLDMHFEVLVYRTGENRVAALSIDVTERRKGQEALRQSEARLRRLVDSNIIGVISIDAGGNIAAANDAFLDIIRYTRDEFHGRQMNLSELTPHEYHQLDENAVIEAIQSGAGMPYEKELIRKDNSRVPVLIGYAYMEDGAPSFICFVVDLSEQKRAEAAARRYAGQLERTNFELARANAELQDFAFVASHDLQEPLRKIQAFGERLSVQMADKLDEESRNYLQRMQTASQRMRAMINDLLSLSRVTTRGRPFERVDLAQVTAEVVSDLEVRIERSGGQVEVHILPTIDGDPTQMRQLMQNLIGNALKFHRPEVPPHVSVYSNCTDGDAVTICIEDNGVGFEEEYLERIFQPFQRLHGMGQYEGSGIGLAICRKIVERHGGTITARSKLGAGSTFIVTLPLQQPLRRETG